MERERGDRGRERNRQGEKESRRQNKTHLQYNFFGVNIVNSDFGRHHKNVLGGDVET